MSGYLLQSTPDRDAKKREENGGKSQRLSSGIMGELIMQKLSPFSNPADNGDDNPPLQRKKIGEGMAQKPFGNTFGGKQGNMFLPLVDLGQQATNDAQKIDGDTDALSDDTPKKRKGEALSNALGELSPVKKTSSKSIPINNSTIDIRISGNRCPHRQGKDRANAAALEHKFFYAASRMVDKNMSMAVSHGSYEIELWGGFRMTIAVDMLKLDSKGDLNMATISARAQKSFESGELKGTALETPLHGFMDLASRINLSIGIKQNINPRDVRNYRKLLKKKKEISKMGSDLSKLREKLDQVGSKNRKRLDAYINEGLEQARARGKAFDEGGLTKQLTSEHKAIVKELRKETIARKNEIRNLEKAARRSKKSAEGLSRKIKSPLLKMANKGLINSLSDLLGRIGKLSVYVEAILSALKAFAAIAAGGRITLFDGKQVDQMTLYTTAELLMEALYNAATDKVIPQGDTYTDTLPEAVPKDLARRMEENDSGATSKDSKHFGNAIAESSDIHGISLPTRPKPGEVGGRSGPATAKGAERTPKGNMLAGLGGKAPQGEPIGAWEQGAREAKDEEGPIGIGQIEHTEDGELAKPEETPGVKGSTGSLEGKKAGIGEEKFKTIDFGNVRYVSGEEVSGEPVSVHVYAKVEDRMRGEGGLKIPLDVVIRQGGTLYAIYFEAVVVRVDVAYFEGEPWYYVEIQETIMAEGTVGRFSLNKGKVYKIRAYGAK